MSSFACERQASMLTADVAELHSALDHHLEQVQAGGQAAINDRGKDIARLVPITRSSSTAGGYADLVARGILIPPKPKPPAGAFRALPRVSDPDGLLLKALLEERGERG